MKLKSFTLFVLLLASGIFFISGCSSNPPVNININEPVRIVLLEKGGLRWFFLITEVRYLPDNPPGAVIIIRNELDRNLTLEFDNDSHYTFSIGDKKQQEVTIQAGKYKLMAAAPGLSFVPRDNEYYFKDRYVTKIVGMREKIEIKYRK